MEIWTGDRSRWLRNALQSIRRRFSISSDQEVPRWDALPNLLTIGAAARILKVHRNTLRLWDQRGTLRAVRLGRRGDRRYDREQVRQLWLQSQWAAPKIPTTHQFLTRERWRQLRRAWYVPVGAALVLLTVIVLSHGNGGSVVAGKPGVQVLTLDPTACRGWEGASKAERTDLDDGAVADQFSADNAALYTSAESQITEPIDPNTIAVGTLNSPVAAVSCEAFDSPAFPSSGSITASELVLSFHSESSGNTTASFVVETSRDGQAWTTVGVLPVQTEHPGRVHVALPTDLDRNALAQLHVRLTPDVNADSPAVTAWLDGIAVSATVDVPLVPDPKKDQQASKELDSLVSFSKDVYRRGEHPVVTLPKVQTHRNALLSKQSVSWNLDAVELVDSGGRVMPALYNTQDATQGDSVDQTLQLDTTSIHAGKYTLRVTMTNSEGGRSTIEKEFLWGVLAVNLTRSAAGSAALDHVVAIGVLDDAGLTICDATIDLTITSPKGAQQQFSTDRNTVVRTTGCVDKGVTNEPDYSAKFNVAESGVYHLKLEAKTAGGKRTLEDNFLIDPTAPVEVQRYDYPTRIYPLASYPVRIAVTTSEDYFGNVAESVPADFAITAVQAGGEVQTDPTDPTRKLIVWPVDWKRGQTHFLQYTFDAPDISPALFLTGPLTVGGGFATAPVFVEPRSWQIASDAILNIGTEDFTPDQTDVIEPLQSAYRSGETVDVKVFKTGYKFKPGKVEGGLGQDQPTTVTKITLLGPDTSEHVVTTTANDIEQNGRVLQILHLNPGRSFHPGIYTLQLTVTDGQTTTVEDRTFAWGVLAVNLRRSIERPTTATSIGLAVLDANGHTLCDNEVTLVVTDPNGHAQTLTTADGTITKNRTCVDRGVTNDFDYAAPYTTGGPGVYHLHMTSNTGNGEVAIDDSFEVLNHVDFEVERTTFSMRIYPLADYQTSFTITANAPYQGVVREVLPASFVIRDVSDGGTVRPVVDQREITWAVNWQAGETHTLGYTIDFPDASPEFYLLGPLTIGSFAEARPWQIASDTTSGTTRFYLNSKDISEENATYNSMLPGTLPEGDTASAGTDNSTTNYTAGTLCEAAGFDQDTAAMVNEETASAERCVATFFTPILGANVVFSTTDTNSISYNVWAAEEGGATTPVLRAYLYEYVEAGSTLNLIDTANSAAVTTALAQRTWTATPDTTTTVDAGNRIVVVFTMVTGTGPDTTGGTDTIDVHFDRVTTAPSYIDMSYTLTTADKPNLTGSNDDDFDENTSCASSCDNTTIGTNPTWTIQTSSNTTTEHVYMDASRSSQWVSITDVKTVDENQATLAGYTYMYQAFPSGDGDITTQISPTMTIDPVTDPQNAQGLVIRFSADTDFLLLQAYQDGAATVVEVNNSGTLTGTTATITGYANNVMLRWSKSGTTYQAKYCDSSASDCTVSGNWTSLGTGITKSNPDQMGLAASLDFVTGTNSQSTASFEFFDSTVALPTITVSGTCNAYDQTTVCTDVGTVAVAVNGTLQAQNQPTIAGTWAITGVSQPASGAIITVFVDAAATAPDRAVAVTKYDGTGDVTAVTLFKEHLTIGSADTAATLTSADLGQYDNSVSAADVDVFHDYRTDYTDGTCAATAGTTVCMQVDKTGFSTQEELYIASGWTYAPDTAGSDVVYTDNLELNGTLNLTGISNNNMRFGGSWVTGGSAVLTADTSLVIATATTGTETIDSVAAAAQPFNNLLIGETSGTATWNITSALDVDGTLTIDRGTLGMNGANNINTAGNVTINANGLYTKSSGTWTFDGSVAKNWTDSSSGVQDLGTVVIDGTTKTVNVVTAAKATQLTVTDTLDLGSSGYILTLTGTGTAAARPFVVTGTLTEGTNSTVKFTGGGATTSEVQNETYDKLDISPSSNGSTYRLGTAITQTVASAGNFTLGNGTNTFTLDWTLYDPTLNVGGGLTLASGVTWTKSDSATLTFNGATTPVTITDNNTTKQDLGLVTVNGTTKTANLGSSITVEKITIGADDVLGLASSGYTLKLTGSGQGAGKPFTITAGGTLTEGTSSTVEYAGTTASDVTTETYNNLSVKPGAAAITHHAEIGSLNVSGSLTVGDGTNTGTFNLDTNDPTFDVNGNVTIAASGTLVASLTAAFTAGANWDNNGTFTHSGGTLTLDATDADNTVEAGSSNYNNVTFSGAAAGNGTWTVQTDDLTVAGTLSVDTGDTLSIASGRTVTLSRTTGAALTLNGTITDVSDNGRLIYKTTDTVFPATGTISSILRMDATAGNQTIGGTDSATRSFGGLVEMYSNDTVAGKTVTLENGTSRTFAFNASLNLIADNTQNITLTADTVNDPTVTITGNLDYTGVGAGSESITSGAGTWSVSGNVNFTDGTYTATSGNTLTLNGSAQQTLTDASQTLHHLTVTNSSGSDPDTSPSVIFADGWAANGTFTATTANTKLRFAASATYAPAAINLNGQATGTRVFLRSSSAGSTFAFNAGAGSRTVSNTAVKDSNACGSTGGEIDASDGTNEDDGNTSCWFIKKLQVSLSGSSIGLGTLSSTQVNQGSITSTVTTSAGAGYVSLVKYGAALTSGSDTIADTTGGTIVAGTSEFGAASSKSGNTIGVWSPTSCATTASTSNATALTTAFQQYGSAAAAVTSDTTTLCILASTTATQAPGSYTSTLTIITTGRF